VRDTATQPGSACRYTVAVPRFNNTNTPQGNDWFDWLPLKVQCLLLLLLTVPATILFSWGGVHTIHTGKPVVLSNTNMDTGEFFLSALFCAFLSAAIFGVMMGWIKPGKPHISETHHPRK
jgi:ABC-type sulfate transport system permease component